MCNNASLGFTGESCICNSWIYCCWLYDVVIIIWRQIAISISYCPCSTSEHPHSLSPRLSEMSQYHQSQWLFGNDSSLPFTVENSNDLNQALSTDDGPGDGNPNGGFPAGNLQNASYYQPFNPYLGPFQPAQIQYSNIHSGNPQYPLDSNSRPQYSLPQPHLHQLHSQGDFQVRTPSTYS